MKWLSILLACCLLAGWICADDPAPYESTPELISLDGYVLFYDARGPDSYATLTNHDLPQNITPLGVVHSQACQHGFSLPFTIGLKAQGGKAGFVFGNGGYTQAIHKLKQQHPDLQGVYDVTVDLHQITILSIYYRDCVEVTAKAFS